MRWSWRLGKIFGIDLFVHFTFLLLLGYVALTHYVARQSVMDAANGLLFILSLFGIVVLHELGHALAARRYGIKTRDITLLPIGGVARLERMPEDPKQELVVALAGPAVNVVLAIALFVGLTLAHEMVAIGDTVRVGGSFLNQLLWVNVSLALFNLIPAFPMDGGRVLRALLAMRFNYVRATQVAATIGQGVAMLFGFVGLVSQNPFLIFIALFVWMGAAQEASVAQMRSAMDGIPVMNAMITNFRTVSVNETLRTALEYVLAGFHQDFPVVDGDRLVGVLTRNDLMVAIQRRGPDTPVSEIMRRDFATADPKDMLPTAFAKLQEKSCHSLPVVENGRLLGLLTTENLAEVLMIQEAMSAEHESRGRFQTPDVGQPRTFGQPFFWKRAHR